VSKHKRICLSCGREFSNVHYITRRSGPRAGYRWRYVREGQRFCSSACGGRDWAKAKVAA
jgi:hypothetical protein